MFNKSDYAGAGAINLRDPALPDTNVIGVYCQNDEGNKLVVQVAFGDDIKIMEAVALAEEHLAVEYDDESYCMDEYEPA